MQATARYEGCVASVWAEAIVTLPEVAAPMASDKELSAGGELTWAIGGFEPVESVVLILASADRVTVEILDEEISDTRGDVVLTGVLPVNLSAGAHDLVAFAPESGTGYRAPVTVDASGVVAPAPTTTVAVGPGAETTTTTTVPGTSTTTTTVATSPGVSVPGPAPTSSTTTTLAQGAQAVAWSPRTMLYTTDSPEMPTSFALSDGPGSISYSIVNAGTTGCSVDATTAELTYSGTGTCTVRADAAASGGRGVGSTTVTFTIATPTCGPKPSYNLGDTGPGGGIIVHEAATCQSWGWYVEVAPANWTGVADSSYRPTWCDEARFINGAKGTRLGAGESNGATIATVCPEGAAVDAREYRGGGKVDWYLGSSLEWHQVCRWAHATAPSQGGGTLCISPSWGASYTNNDGFTDHYWTSTQVNETDAIENWMPGGNDFRSVSKDTGYVSSRPVRAFGGPASPDASIVPAVRYSTSRTIDFTVDFSSAISGLSGSDFSNIGTASGCTCTPTASAGTSIGVQAVCSSDGTVITRLAANAVTDGVLTGPVSPVNGQAVPVDSILPTVTLTETGALTLVEGTAIGGTLDERGTLYLAAATISVTTASDITSAADADWNSIVVGAPGTTENLNTKGLDPGSYTIYGVDLAGNVNPVGATTLTVRAAQNCTTNCLIGDTGPGGGIVVYDAGSVQSWGRYLEVAPANWSGGPDSGYRPIWCDTPGSVTGATNSAIGTGATNTAAMVAGCSSGAAVDIAAYAGGGLTDWFLPSEDEQRAVCRYAHANYRGASGCGGTFSYVNNPGFTDHYWTSTQISATVAIQTWMPGSNDYRQVDPATSYVSARPMRAF